MTTYKKFLLISIFLLVVVSVFSFANFVLADTPLECSPIPRENPDGSFYYTSEVDNCAVGGTSGATGAPPSVTLTISSLGQVEDIIDYNSPVTISWQSSSPIVHSCSGIVCQSNCGSSNRSGSRTDNLISDTTYSISCSNAYGYTTATRTIKVVNLTLENIPPAVTVTKGGDLLSFPISAGKINIQMGVDITRNVGTTNLGGDVVLGTESENSHPATLTIGAGNANPGTYNITVSATGTKVGGGDISVSQPITVTVLAPATTGTLSTTGCDIEDGASFCRPSLSWTTTNPISLVTSRITLPDGLSVLTGNNGDNVLGPLITYGKTPFYLRHSNLLLDGPVEAEAKCKNPLSSWIGGKCTPLSGSLSVSSCAIPQGQTTCRPNFTWNVPYPIAGQSITIKRVDGSVILSGSSGTNAPGELIPFGQTTYRLYSGTTLLASATASATGVCATPLTRNVSVSCDVNQYGDSAVSGSVTRSQTKTAYPGCLFPEPVTVENSTYVSDNCIYSPVCSSTHYNCNVGINDGTENYETTNSWAWMCYTMGNMANCIEYKPPLCSSTHYNCSPGSLVNSSETSSQWLWTCANPVGQNVNCTKNKPPTGTLSASNCVIASGQSSCTPSLTWNVVNPIVGQSIQIKKADGTVVHSGNNGTSVPTTPLTIPWGTTTFNLFSNTTLLASDIAAASCISGTTWDGNKCAPNTCPAPLTRNVTVACDVSSYGYTAVSGSVTRSQDKTAYPGCSFPEPVTVENSIYVSDNCVYPTPVCSSSHYGCGVGTSINPQEGSSSWTWTCTTFTSQTAQCSEEKTINGNISISENPCTIQANASSCTTSASWSIQNATIPNMFSSYTNSILSTSLSGTMVVAVGYPSSTFYARNNTSILDSETVNAICVAGTNWNSSEGRCLTITVSPVGSLSMNPPSCVINENSSTCIVQASWTTENATNPNLFDANVNGILSSNHTGGGINVWVAYPQTVFNLRNDTSILDSQIVTASCEEGTIWDYLNSKCVIPAPLSPTSSISVNPNSIQIGGSATLSWSSLNTNSCTGTNFDTNGQTSGSLIVSPEYTTSYSIVCIGDGGQTYDTTTLLVTTVQKKPIYKEE